MTGHVRVSSAFRLIDGMWVRVSTAWRVVVTAHVRVASAWRLWFWSLSASLPAGQHASGTVNFHIFTPVTVAVSNGIGPFTYSWSFGHTDAGAWSFITATNGPTVQARVDAVPFGNPTTAALSCTVTDQATGISTLAGGIGLTYVFGN